MFISKLESLEFSKLIEVVFALFVQADGHETARGKKERWLVPNRDALAYMHTHRESNPGPVPTTPGAPIGDPGLSGRTQHTLGVWYGPLLRFKVATPSLSQALWFSGLGLPIDIPASTSPPAGIITTIVARGIPVAALEFILVTILRRGPQLLRYAVYLACRLHSASVFGIRLVL